MTIEFVRLDNNGWAKVEAHLNAGQRIHHLTQNLLRHLGELGAQSVVVESEYLDRDFSEAYSAFYSRLFRRHTKLCKRLLFFSEDLESVLNLEDAAERSRRLENLGKTAFLGFITLRPVDEAPVAQVVLKVPAPPPSLDVRLQVKAPVTVHSLGAEFTVEGIPMTQQDQRIGACAQASIWTCARHFYHKHRGPWVSMVGVNELAMARAQWGVSRTIPNGSEFLSINEMVAAIHGVGRKPLVYMAEELDPIKWVSLRPLDIICRYVDSGIPVILGITKKPIGHAIVATGQVLAASATVSTIPDKPTRSIFCDAIIVNDDQSGPNQRMATFAGSKSGETPYTIDDIGYLLIGMPDKVFLPAEKAEEFSWDILLEYAHRWPALVASHAVALGSSIANGNSFVADITAKQVVARTYLTYGWKYKHRIVRNIISNGFKEEALYTDLPRYVWVTEFGTIASLGNEDYRLRRVFAHCVVDATAKNMIADCRLLFHAPGLMLQVQLDPTSSGGAPAYSRNISVIHNDSSYYPKRRGEMDFLY